MAGIGQTLFGLLIGIVAMWALIHIVILNPLESLVGESPVDILLVMIATTLFCYGMWNERYGISFIGVLVLIIGVLNHYT